MEADTAAPPVWIKSGDAARRVFGVSNDSTTARIRRLVDSGELIGKRVGVRGDRYVRSDSLDNFMTVDHT